MLGGGGYLEFPQDKKLGVGWFVGSLLSRAATHFLCLLILSGNTNKQQRLTIPRSSVTPYPGLCNDNISSPSPPSFHSCTFICNNLHLNVILRPLPHDVNTRTFNVMTTPILVPMASDAVCVVAYPPQLIKPTARD